MKPKAPRVPKSADDKEQSERFVEAVSPLEGDPQAAKRFEKMFRAVVRPKPQGKKS